MIYHVTTIATSTPTVDCSAIAGLRTPLYSSRVSHSVVEGSPSQRDGARQDKTGSNERYGASSKILLTSLMDLTDTVKTLERINW